MLQTTVNYGLKGGCLEVDVSQETTSVEQVDNSWRAEFDEIMRKFWHLGYSGLDDRERRILAYGYTKGGCPTCGR